MGASPRLYRHSSASVRGMVFATTVLVLLGASCAERDPDDAVHATADDTPWTDAHDVALGRLDGAIELILSAVEGNDVRLMGVGPERCATEAGSLAVAAREAGALVDGERLDDVASLCAWLGGPAAVHDVDGVVRTLDPLFTAVGRIAPLLDRPDSLS